MKTSLPVPSTVSTRAVSAEGAPGFLSGELVPTVRQMRDACNRALGYRVKLADAATLIGLEALVEVDASSGPVTVTLADVEDTWREVKVVKTDASANAVTVVGPIDGASSATLAAQYDSALLWPGETEFHRDALTATSPSSSGEGQGFRFTFSATTTDADPGAGTFRANNAALASATLLYVDLAEYAGTDITAWLDALDDYQGATMGLIRLRSLSDPTKWIEYVLTGWTTAAGYRKLTVVYRCGPGGLLTAAGDTFLSVDTFQTWGAPTTDAGTSYTYVLADADREVGHTSGSAITGTIPPNSAVPYRLGTRLRMYQAGAGQLTLAPGVGVTLRTPATLKTRAQYSALEAVQIAANEWLVAGDLEL